MKRALILPTNIFYHFNDDEWDSFRGEGRPIINNGFGLSLLDYKVNISCNEWNLDKSKKTWNEIELSKTPIYDYYNVVLTHGLPNIPINFKFEKFLCTVYESKDITRVREFEKSIGKKVIYIVNNNDENETIKIKKLVNSENIFYIPQLRPIPSINIGFIEPSYNPDFSNLKVLIHHSTWNQNTTIGSDRFIDKEKLILKFLKEIGYKINLTILILNEDTKNKFIFEDEILFNETNFVYSEKCSYFNIISLIQDNDICITYGAPVFGGSSLSDMISLGKPVIYIGDGRIGIEWKQEFLHIMYKNKDIRDNYIIYIQEKDDISIKKLKNIMKSPIKLAKKYSDLYKDTNFYNWKKIIENVILYNNYNENTNINNGDNLMPEKLKNSEKLENDNDNEKVNKFGDGISWENHVNEILNSHNISDIFYSSNDDKINKLKKYKKEGRLLDCGCHIGRWFEVFKKSGYKYTGIDQSLLAIETFKKFKPDAVILHSLLWDMKFNEEFDIVHFNAVLQHNKLEEQEKIIEKVNKALKLDGILIIAESTVDKQTSTQRTYSGWINFIENYGFKFMESWNKNEINLEDNYIFTKVKKLEELKKISDDISKNITKEKLYQFLNKSKNMSENTKECKPEITIPNYPSINVNIETTKTKDYSKVMYINEYWNHDLKDNIIPFIECIVMWRRLKVDEKCCFIYSSNLLERSEFIKSVFEKAGFEFIRSYTENKIEIKLEFKKLSIININNWKYLRNIHELLNLLYTFK